MPLDKQLVSVDFTGGLDTKTDAKLILPGKLTRLENGAFREKSIGKRYGSARLSANVQQGGVVAAGGGLAMLNGDLLLESGGSLYARTATQWSKVVDGGGTKNPLFATLSRQPVVRNTDTQQEYDQATIGGATVYAWAETSNAVGVHVMVVDSTTGALIVPDTIVNSLVPAGSGQPRVVSNGVDKVFVFYALANKICYVSYTSGGSSLAAELQPISDFNTGASGQFDVVWCPAGAGAAVPSIYVAYLQNVTNDLALAWFAADMASTLAATQAFAVGTTHAIGLAAATDGVVACVHSDGANGWVETIENGVRVGGSGVRAGTWTFSAGGSFDRVAVWMAAGGTGGCVFESGGHLYTAGFGTFTGVTSQPVVALYNVRLISRVAFLNGILWAGVVNQPPAGSSVQPTGFLVNWGAAIDTTAVARVLPGLCSAPAGNRLATPIPSGTGLAYLFPERGRLAYSSAGGGSIDKTALGFSRITFTPCSLKDVPVCQVGPLLYIGGARPLVFDGQRLFDAGFQLVPEGLSAASGGAGSLSAGTYGFQAVYAFTDAQGHLHRSAPSPLLQYVAGAADSANITGLSLGETLLGQYTVWVEIYRTTANGTALYRVGAPPGAAVNTKITSTWVAAGGGADTALVAGEVLYTTGGGLDNIGPPAYGAACVHQSRLFLFGLEDPYEIRFSTEYVKGEGLRFNEVLSMRVPSTTGKVICGASMDDKLFIFTEQAVYAVVGTGPNALGLNSSYSAPQLISADSGCSVPRSVAVMQDGVMFRAPRGICLVGHDLSAQFIGAEVEAFNGHTIRSAVVVPDQNQVRFQCDTGSDLSGIALVYDYLFRQWSTFTGYGAIDAVVSGGLYTRLHSDGALLQEALGAFLEDGAAYSLLAESAWLKPAGVQGLQRIWRALVLGDCKSQPTSFAISVGYDYDPTYASADQASFTGSLTAGKPFQIRLHLRKQKCEAIRFLLTETPSGGTNEGISLSSLMLEVGVRRGAFKLSGGNTAIQGP